MTLPSLDPDQLGIQLRHPKGELASKVGDLMFASNAKMIYNTIDLLQIRHDALLLEIGFGNGKHLPYLLSQATHLSYYGIETSQAMVGQAEANNPEAVQTKTAHFIRIDRNVNEIDQQNKFDICFSVNSIYFWDDPLESLHAIRKALKPNGQVALTFIEKEFGEQLPFTNNGFRFFREAEIEMLLRESSFRDIQIAQFVDQAISKDSKKVDRPYRIARARKPTDV